MSQKQIITEVALYAPKQPRKARVVRKKPKPRKRIKKRATSTTKADTLFSKFIRARDGKCVRCDKTEYLQNSHFWPRAISSVRYDSENCDALCYGCHYGDRINGWEYAKHGDYRDFKLNQLGEERYNALRIRAKTTMKRTEAISIFMESLQTTLN